MKTNKTILITGGNTGIGEAIAIEMSKKKIYTIIITSRSFEFTRTQAIKENSITSQYLDVTHEDSVKNLFAWITAQNTKIDVLINNAGIGIFKPITEITCSEWNQSLQTNLTGAFLCAKEAFIHMQASGGGRIINIGSIAEKNPLHSNAAYGASKAGLKYLSDMLNTEGKPHKIRATHITLGATYTPIWKTRPEFSKSDMLTTEHVAHCIENLVSLPLDIRVDSIELLPEKGIL